MVINYLFMAFFSVIYILLEIFVIPKYGQNERFDKYRWLWISFVALSFGYLSYIFLF